MLIDGRKFSASAVYARGRVMHHGTIMFSSDMEAVEGALCVSAAKIESRE